MDAREILNMVLEWMVVSGLRILIICVLTIIAIAVSRILSRRLIDMFTKKSTDEESKKRSATLGSLIRYILSVGIIITAGVMILGELGIEIGPILAAAGVVGLALGFGSQHLVQDVISGFFIILDDEIRVGDVVQTAGKSGMVEQVNLRLTVLRDFSGNVHYVRNGQIDIVTNMTKDYSRYVFNIGVAYREDVDEVMDVIRRVDEDMRKDEKFAPLILEPIEVLGLDEFADSALIIKARVKTKPIQQWNVAREFNRRLKKAFDARGIEIPFPHMTVYAGQDKQGGAAPHYIVSEAKAATTS